MSISSGVQPKAIERPGTETQTLATTPSLRRHRCSLANRHGGSLEDSSAPNACRRHSDLLHARHPQVVR